MTKPADLITAMRIADSGDPHWKCPACGRINPDIGRRLDECFFCNEIVIVRGDSK